MSHSLIVGAELIALLHQGGGDLRIDSEGMAVRPVGSDEWLRLAPTETRPVVLNMVGRVMVGLNLGYDDDDDNSETITFRDDEGNRGTVTGEVVRGVLTLTVTPLKDLEPAG